ncbi:MAG TPA: SGNH/GDSL hydrolase family protein [Vicinamibacterales bacterium]|nr:SGNH/GDSL hydrolase family protein [Vicinamibacterales bacterium]
MPAETLSRKTKFVLYLIMAATPVLFAEALVRAYFSTQVGPSVLLYGTPWSRHQEKFDPKGVEMKKAEDESSVAFHQNVTAGYSKYYPSELLFDRDEFGTRFTVTINSHGFRGRDFQSAKRPGVIRIVTLGASSTFGFRSPDHQTYPVFLEQNLSSALAARHVNDASAPVTEFEVINLGIPHLTSDQIYALLAEEGLALKPDFVTFYEGINDAAWKEAPDTTTERTKQAVKTVPFANQAFRALRARLLSVALIGSVISDVTTVYSSEDFQDFRKGKRDRFIGNLQRLADLCQKNGIRLIVASQSATSLEFKREQLKTLTYSAEQAALRQKLAAGVGLEVGEADLLIHGELMDAEREWAIANEVPYADVIAAMDGSRQNHVTWVHLNAAGNQVVASVLSEAILKELGRKGE